MKGTFSSDDWEMTIEQFKNLIAAYKATGQFTVSFKTKV